MSVHISVIIYFNQNGIITLKMHTEIALLVSKMSSEGSDKYVPPLFAHTKYR